MIKNPRVGMKVRYRSYLLNTEKALEGRIVGIDPDDMFLAIEFQNFEGHDCEGYTPENNGWWVPAYSEHLIEIPKFNSLI